MRTYRKSRTPCRHEYDGEYRDDRIFIVACDDRYAPEQYFSFFRIPRVKVVIVPTEDCTSHARYVLERLLAHEHEVFDELWMLLDTDHCIQDGHFRAFKEALSEARRRKIKVALSRPCFEFWLALHAFSKEEVLECHWETAEEVERALSARLGHGYNKTNLRKEDYVASLSNAVRLAREIDETVAGGYRPVGNTTRVYRLWDSLMKGMSPKQRAELPECLRTIAADCD